MTTRVKLVNRISDCQPADLVANVLAKSGDSLQADYILVVNQPDDHLVGHVENLIAAANPADVIVIYDRVRRARWKRLQEQLPPLLFLIAANPEYDSAIAFSVSSLNTRAQTVNRSRSWRELAFRLSEAGQGAFVAADERLPSRAIPVPRLTISDSSPPPDWLREIIHQLKVPGARPSPTNLSALKAGLFLVNDFFEESHSCSQSIEGLGAHHTGDYWHAILHRREPDYGNSKYWFRHVGRHPVFTELAQAATGLLNSATGSMGASLERWKGRLVSGGHWDPMAFVDLCQASESDPPLQEWCEQLQLQEMLLLLESTFREMLA